MPANILQGNPIWDALFHSGALVGLLSSDFRYLKVNQELCNLLGYTEEEMLGMTVLDVTHPDDRERDAENLRKILATQKAIPPFEKRYVRKNGELIHVLVAPAPVWGEDGSLQYLITQAQDVSELKKKERDIRRLNRLHQALSHASQAISHLRDNGGLFEAVCRSLVEQGRFDMACVGRYTEGRDRVEFVASAGDHHGYLDTLVIRVGDVPEGQGPTGRALAEWKTQTENHWQSSPVMAPWLGLAQKSGWQSSIAVPIVEQNGAKYVLMAFSCQEGYFGKKTIKLFEDIASSLWLGLIYQQSERERDVLEKQLARTQKMDSLGSLAGGVAHDMNNVLGAVLSMASLQEDRSDLPNDVAMAFATITKACLRGRDMVQSLLGFSRHDLTENTALSLNHCVREHIALLEHTTMKRIEIEMGLDESVPIIHGDASAICHALMNVSVNAIDAMPEGGTLRFRTWREPKWVGLEIRDNGIGMAPGILERAMDPFFTTKARGKGTGMGLSLVYSTVKAHHGELDLKSDPGNGTTVVLRFPVDDDVAGADGVETKKSVHGRDETKRSLVADRSLQVLLVDDDVLIQETVSMALERKGHHVQVARDGAEALKALDHPESPWFDIVILDMNMPIMSGDKALPLIRERDPDLPILLASGYTDQDLLNLSHRFEGVVVLPKPYTIKELDASFGELLGGSVVSKDER